MEELVKLLTETKNGIDFYKEDHLLDDGLIGSLEILTFVIAIEKKYSIKIPISKIKPQNFNSAVSMWKMINEIKGK